MAAAHRDSFSHLAALIALLAAGFTPGLDAQTSPAAPRSRIALSLGAARMSPLHGDDYHEGPVLLAGLSLGVTPRVLVEVEVTRRQFTEVDERFDVIVPITAPVAVGTTGHAEREVFSRGTSDWTAGVNLLYRRPGHGWAVFFGGGAGWHHESARRSLIRTNCTPPSSSPDGRECAAFDLRESSTDLGLQSLAGAEVTLTSRLHALATVRYEVRADLGMGTFGFTGGVRLGLR